MTPNNASRTLMSGAGCNICTVEEQHVLVSFEYAVVSVSPAGVRLGHMVVASRRHVESFAELDETEVDGLMKVLGRIAVVAERTMPSERYYAFRIGDKTPHLHFHLIPRMTGDGDLGPFIFGERGWAPPVAKPISDQDLDGFVRRFKAALTQNPTLDPLAR